MANLKFKSGYDHKDRPILRVIDGQILEEVGHDLGMLWWEPRDNPDAGYWYYSHPKNEIAFRNMSATFKHFGLRPKFDLTDAAGNDLKQHLLPMRVPSLSKYFSRFFSGDTYQAPKKVLKQVMRLIALYHPHLASAAVLVVIEDYDPKKRSNRLRRRGYINNPGRTIAYTSKTSKGLREATGFDFKIALCEEIWPQLPTTHKEYVLDHELMHCGRNDRGKWELWNHDVQMFTEEVKRYPDHDMVRTDIEQVIMARNAGRENEEEE